MIPMFKARNVRLSRISRNDQPDSIRKDCLLT
jgi:hypothetical protein